MRRRKLLQILVALPFAAGTIALVGCNRPEKTEAPPVAETTPEPIPTPTEEVAVEASPSPETPPVEPTDAPPEEPAAPYGTLTENQKERVNAVMEALSEVNADETKRWTDNLAYDTKGAERELRAWERIADAYRRFVDLHPDLTAPGKGEAFSAIMMRSMLPEADAIRYVHLSALTADDARAAMGLLSLPGAAVTAEPTPVASPEATP